MKKFIMIAALLMVGISAMAQVTGRGIYGTSQPYAIYTGKLYNNSLVSVSADTLKGVDTSYVYFTFNNPYKTQFTLQTVQKGATTFTGTAVLQAYAGTTAGWVTRSTGWLSAGGDTVRCTGCVGLTKVFTTASGTNKATWDIGQSTFSNWRLKIIGTASTDTTIVSGTSLYSY